MFVFVDSLFTTCALFSIAILPVISPDTVDVCCLCSPRSCRQDREDSDCCEARWSSTSPCWPDHTAVWAAGLQDGWSENVAGTDVANETLCPSLATALHIFPLWLPLLLQVHEDLLSQHYGQLRTKPFYPKLLNYMTSGPVVVMVRCLCFCLLLGCSLVSTSRLTNMNTLTKYE